MPDCPLLIQFENLLKGIEPHTVYFTLHWHLHCAAWCLFKHRFEKGFWFHVCSDDTPVASAKAGPSDGSGGVDEDGNTNNGRLWRSVIIGEQEHRIDMQVIRPYLRVITHGGQ